MGINRGKDSKEFKCILETDTIISELNKNKNIFGEKKHNKTT